MTIKKITLTFIFTLGSLETSLNYDGLNCMIHEIEKGIFACTECGKSSRNKKDLKRHIASKHMEGEPVR